ALLAAAVVGVVVTADPPAVDRAEAIGSKIRCPVCQGEAIADSPSGLAQDMMDLV
ncbi:MAG: cytochrome c-type biogenesis protein CcmH, partial [Gemmatimonadetes bacterium]|nr:cytochrome c-type biogenesis protein CcmH [Gemmatimonadota bacterium]NIR41434.1 cytochrome c-type biogenesis protein CcmH [Actinomycetota bacterium]NIS36453.1 cytochrome c-type biogenesis protein CcmH [Actinomycetota bacterium]NIU70962.1 cytochrome c-type biogenesis protein CcmH [Actinomycetota bacterium]NIW32904.1 cytochrome c-type biogenesis protein CcmH [Actinomycetota bacterium]